MEAVAGSSGLDSTDGAVGVRSWGCSAARLHIEVRRRPFLSKREGKNSHFEQKTPRVFNKSPFYGSLNANALIERFHGRGHGMTVMCCRKPEWLGMEKTVPSAQDRVPRTKSG